MGVKSELNKLARIQVDIPSSLDAEWTLDVKKSAAKIPDSIKEELIASTCILSNFIHITIVPLATLFILSITGKASVSSSSSILLSVMTVTA